MCWSTGRGVEGGSLASASSPPGVHSKARVVGAEAVVDSHRHRPDRTVDVRRVAHVIDIDTERLGAVVVVVDEHDRRADPPEVVEQQGQGASGRDLLSSSPWT